MLHSAETASSSPILPVESIPCSQSQDAVASPCSYVIGLLDPTHLLTMQARLCTGEAYTLLVPVQVPRSILNDPAFRDGHAWNVATEDEQDEEKEWTTMVTRVVNHIHTCLTEACFCRDVATGEVVRDFLPWQVGWLLRDLTRFAEIDRTLASVGLAHLCFLLPLLMQERPSDWSRYEPSHAHTLHDRAVKAYRACVQVYREQGKSYDEAQRLALCQEERG